MKKSAAVVMIILFLPKFIMASDSTIHRLEIKHTLSNEVVIEWTADSNVGVFKVYQNFNQPISNAPILSNSTNLFFGFLAGITTNSNHLFSTYDHYQLNPGSNYFAVLLYQNKTNHDILSDINYNIIPVFPLIPVIPIDTNMIIDHISVKTEQNHILIFWDINRDYSFKNNSFLIYKTTNIIEDYQRLKDAKPLKLLTDEYYYEDFDFEIGVPYYYTIIANSNQLIIPGKNQNLEPVYIGKTNIQVKVEKEILFKTNRQSKDYKNQFN